MSPEEALGEASTVLQELGFEFVDSEWIGSLHLKSSPDVSIRLRLPSLFPIRLPEIFVNRSTLPRRIPHIEKNGKVCIAPTTGILLDSGNPYGLIRESLERAARVIERGVLGELDEDFKREFLAYWNEEANEGAISVVAANTQIDEVVLAEVTSTTQLPYGRKFMFANTERAASRWINSVGAIAKSFSKAFFLTVDDSFTPPDFETIISNDEFLQLIATLIVSEKMEHLKGWLHVQRLPVSIVLNCPVPGQSDRVLIAVRINASTGPTRKNAQKGFRPNNIPLDVEWPFIRNLPIVRLRLDRFDSDYVMPRGGS